MPAVKRKRLPLRERPVEWMFDVYYRHVCQGEKQTSIALEYNISRQKVSRVVAQVEDYLANEPWHVDRINRAKARQWERLEHVYYEAWRAFQRSVTENTKRVVLGKDRGADSDLVEETTSRRAGDPRFLREMRGALEDQRKMMGMNAPQKRAWTDAQGDKDAKIRLVLENASDEELERLAEFDEFVESVMEANPN